jgi:hypothetical protein
MTANDVRRVLQQLVDGKTVDEAKLREALAAMEAVVATQFTATEQPVQRPDSRVTVDEAVRVLAALFRVMETTLVAMRSKVGKAQVLIAADVADAFIDAQSVLKRAGHEPVSARRDDPVRLTQVVRRG